jgi:glycerate 2-kinase
MPDSSLNHNARTIWQAGVDAVDSERLIANAVQLRGTSLVVCDQLISLNGVGRIVVVGAGKAGAGMAVGVEKALGEKLVVEKVTGWINIPEDCLRPTQAIRLHPARPAGHNEPTQAGVDGSLKILELVSELGPNDICLVLLSGGGSALLPAPVEAISLEDKQTVTRFLMHAGASINELNCVRKQLSRIKGGRLATASRAGLTMSLIISDVIGDPLDVIASGPTVADSSTPEEALAVLKRFITADEDVPAIVLNYLSSARTNSSEESALKSVRNHVIGNNRVAVLAAAERARELGYEITFEETDRAGVAAEIGCKLAEQAVSVRDSLSPGSSPQCLLSGGEPIVHLTRTDQPRKGGRNQELVLAGVQRLWEKGMTGIVLLSGGTDGEDGPTDAAGAIADASILASAKEKGLLPEPFLAINNSYAYFEQAGGLLKTGPTHTNVMDLRVVLVQPAKRPG